MNKFVLVLAIAITGALASASCEDDPTDLDYLKDGGANDGGANDGGAAGSSAPAPGPAMDAGQDSGSKSADGGAAADGGK